MSTPDKEETTNRFVFDMVVEIPRYSNVKYEYDKVIEAMRCDRIINTAHVVSGQLWLSSRYTIG